VIEGLRIFLIEGLIVFLIVRFWLILFATGNGALDWAKTVPWLRFLLLFFQ
jgi:hypothetical protein